MMRTEFFHNERGTVALEAVFALPFLILLGLGAVDYSNMLISHHKMQSGLTSAGNFLAKSRAPQNYESQARNLAVTGNLSGGAPLIPGWDNNDVTISYRTVSNANGEYRGEQIVQIVSVSSDVAYQGFGFVNAITPGGAAIMTDSYEARVTLGGT